MTRPSIAGDEATLDAERGRPRVEDRVRLLPLVDDRGNDLLLFLFALADDFTAIGAPDDSAVIDDIFFSRGNDLASNGAPNDSGGIFLTAAAATTALAFLLRLLLLDDDSVILDKIKAVAS